MRIFNGFEHIGNLLRPVVTIGSFDGVHRGHREILSRLTTLSHERNGVSIVITFHPHPRLVLGQGERLQLLTTLSEKLDLFEKLGIDNVIITPFSENFSKLEAEEFIRDYLVGILHIDTLTVGYNHHLGHNREGTSESLECLAHEFGFRLEKMPQQRVDDKKVSSTVIRELIRAGQVEEAAHYLGSPYQINGSLSPRGNLEEIDPLKLIPPLGEYRVSLRYMQPKSGDSPSIPVTIVIKKNRQITVKLEQNKPCKALFDSLYQPRIVRIEFQ